MKNVHLVTGGNGFLGHLIARRLLENGKRVRVLDIWDFPERSSDIEFVHCDIMDRDGVAKAMQDVSVVHHNVALVPLTKSGDRFMTVNRDGSRIAAEEAVRAGVDSFIHMSSSAIFGKPQQCPVTNETPLHPFEIYGKAKLEGEQVVRKICDGANLPLVVIRPRTILGDGRLGIFQVLFQWILENRKIYLIGKGSNQFQFVHAHDLMDFYMLALSNEQPGNYNVGTAQFGTLRDDLEYLFKSVSSSSHIVGLPVGMSVLALRMLDRCKLSPLAPWHYETYHLPFHFDVEPLIKMGWQPKYSNREMFLESYQWFIENRERLQIEKNASAHRRPLREGILNILRKLS